ncbi:MAG: insulinase family protein [Acidobacteriota bacterium]|nr:insulinase family protein [Acidobacteriota bacterium]
MLEREARRGAVAAALVAAALVAPAAARPQVTDADEIEYPPLPPFEVPEPTRIALDNGMLLVLVEDHELPLIEAFARIRTGQRLDPSGLAGLAALTGEVMRTGGTERLGGDEIDELLEGRAAFVESAIGVDSGRAAMSCLAEDFGEVLEVFADVLRRPVFDEDKIAVAKNQARAAIARQNDDPQGILFREFAEVLLGADSPYTRPDTYTSIARITRDDLKAFHGRYYHPNSVILGLVGDFDTAAAVEQVRRVFGDWAPGPPGGAFEGGYKTEPTPGVFYVEKNDVTQSSILMGHLGVRKDNPDYYAIQVFNEVLGGGFSSRLFSRVRSRLGLAYSVSGGLGSEWDREGRFQLYTTTKTETTGAAIEALIAEARKISGDEPPTAAEVERAKQAILSSFVFTSDSSSKILGHELDYEYYGYPLDWLERYFAGIREVTLEQVRAIGERYVKAGDFTIVVVGPRGGRDRPLADFGPVTEIDVSIPELEIEAAAASPEMLARGGELVAAAVAAHGGRDSLASFESVRQRATAVAATPAGRLQVEIDQLVVYPDRLRQALTLPQGTMVQVVTPESAFLETPAGRQPLEGDRRRSFAAGLGRTLPVFLRAAVEGTVEAAAVGSGEVGGVPVEYVRLTSGGQSFQIAVEAASGRILELAFRGTDFVGTPGEVRQAYADFREAGGLVLPFSVEATFEGAPYMTSTITEALVDEPVDPALFLPAE